ncbi:MAG TPA: crossover junction endodeoxyribonuclease RuvC [Candidatus Moranbacteria bacterium]|nr:crossover junction endodeoxyribonuclease RuvC [Candidatus Moranbacteria bacterium]
MDKKLTTQVSGVRVLGIDPGTATVGWAIIEEINGVLCPIAFGHISTEKDKSEENRLCEISCDIQNIIEKYKPQEAAVEQLFFFKNKKTIISIGQSRGAILLTLEQKNVSISSYTPLQVKQSVTGYGKAEKRQIQLMVKSILKLKSIPKPDDVADAIAVAICHINSRKINNL